MATTDDVRAAFEARLREGIPNPPGEFHPSDLQRTRDDKYLMRLLAHQKNDIKKASDMLWNILVWRKTFNVNDINENTIRMDYVKEGMIFPHGRDIYGNLLFIIKFKKHVKGQKDFEELKRVIIYWFERIEREEQGKPVSLFFDLDGCGLSNLDMDLVNCFITLLDKYYPEFLEYIIIFELPWILSTAFKIVKSVLPASAGDLMKCLSKSNLKDIIAPEQALTCWGGKNPYVFEFVSEARIRNDTHTRKKVSFVEPASKLTPSRGDDQHSPGEMLRLVPYDTIVFKHENDDISGQFTITNMDKSVVSFKIKTTSPEKFRVRPSSGLLAAGSSQTVELVGQPGFRFRTANKDRFLVMSVKIPKMDVTPKEMTKIWQKSSSSKVDEYMLKCQFPEENIMKDGSIQEKLDSVTNAFDSLRVRCDMLHTEIRTLKFFQLFTLIVTVCIFLLVYMSSGKDYCVNIGGYGSLLYERTSDNN